MTEVKGLERLSWSRLSAYAQCSLKWKFHYSDGLPGAWNPSPLVAGVAFHKCAEAFLQARMWNETVAVSELVSIFTRTFDEQAAVLPVHYGSKESRESLIELASRMLEAWTSWERPACRILAVEHEIRFKLADHLSEILARVDLLEEHDDFIAVVDIKTAKTCLSDSDLQQKQGQLALYRAAVAPLAAEIGKPIRCALEYVTKQKTVQVERIYIKEIEPLERTIQTATMIVEGIKNQVFFPQRSWACLSCPHQRECSRWPAETAKGATIATAADAPLLAAATR